jgi:ATP-dependent protease HslVU (ClpYQ) ATPase subunit
MRRGLPWRTLSQMQAKIQDPLPLIKTVSVCLMLSLHAMALRQTKTTSLKVRPAMNTMVKEEVKGLLNEERVQKGRERHTHTMSGQVE